MVELVSVRRVIAEPTDLVSGVREAVLAFPA